MKELNWKMEVINNLLNFDKIKIFQNTDWFSFSLDSVLLANFAQINKKTSRIIDFCTGNIPIPLILSQKTDKTIEAVEIQKEIYDLAVKTININNLSSKIKLYNMDIKELPKKYETDTFDLITCNPPFFKINENTKRNDDIIKSIARHEIKVNLNDIFSVAKKLLKNNGSICIVHRTDRLIDIITTMKDNNIEPKRIQFVFPKRESNSNIVLIEGTKNGKSGLKILKPLYIHNEDGEYLEEIKAMFN